MVIIKVVPGSGRHGWKVDKAGNVVCYLKSQAEKGLANKELIRVLAKELSIAQVDIEIISGHTSRLKKIKIMAGNVITQAHLLEQLGLKNAIDTSADHGNVQINMFDAVDR